MIFLENAESGTYTLKVTGLGKGKYTVVVGQITTDNDYWENIAGEITKDPASSQTDTYTINYPGSPLFPKATGGSSSTTSTTTTTTASATSTPTPTPKSANANPRIDDILGASSDEESSASGSSSGERTTDALPTYQSPQPTSPWRLIIMWWLIGSGVFLLFLAFFITLRGKERINSLWTREVSNL